METPAVYQEYVRDCDTCLRTQPGTQVCALRNLDIDTCLQSPSRPFYRPRPDADNTDALAEAQEFVRHAWRRQIDGDPGAESAGIMKTQWLIREECKKIQELLLEKNRKYGDSAINPLRIFSDADPVAQIDVRIDDKLSRIRSAQDDDTEDAEQDLVGYLILKRVAVRTFQGKVRK